MLKRMVTIVAIVAVLVWLPLLAGCSESPDVETHGHKEVRDQPVKTEIVVE